MSTAAEDRITKTPDVCGGKACIAGHRVRVLDVVVWHEHQGMTPDEIVSHVPTMRAERAYVDEFRRSHASLLEPRLRDGLEKAS